MYKVSCVLYFIFFYVSVKRLEQMHTTRIFSPSKEKVVARVSCTNLDLLCCNREDEVVPTTQDDQANWSGGSVHDPIQYSQQIWILVQHCGQGIRVCLFAKALLYLRCMQRVILQLCTLQQTDGWGVVEEQRRLVMFWCLSGLSSVVEYC
jgi:hypothetical protein